MDAKNFWDVIAHYNQDTWVIQIIFIFMIIFSAAILYKRKNQWLFQIALGLTNLFIGIVFLLSMEQSLFKCFCCPSIYNNRAVIRYQEQ